MNKLAVFTTTVLLLVCVLAADVSALTCPNRCFKNQEKVEITCSRERYAGCKVRECQMRFVYYGTFNQFGRHRIGHRPGWACAVPLPDDDSSPSMTPTPTPVAVTMD